MIEVMLLGAGFTTNNMGVWALTSGIVGAVLHAHPDAKIYLLDYHYRPETYIVKCGNGNDPIQLINLRFSKKFWVHNNIARLLATILLIKVLPSRALREKLISRNHYLKRIKMADMVGSISGGDSFSDIYGFRRFIYTLLPQLLVLFMGKHLIILPQTLGPFNGAVSKYFARYVVKRAQIVFSRDREGIKEVSKRLQVDAHRIRFGYDMGFALEPQIIGERIPAWLIKYDRNRPLVGINISGLLCIGGYTQNNMFGLKAEYRALVNKLIAHFIQEHRANIMLVPHVFGSVENKESDLSACQIIYDDTSMKLRSHIKLIDDKFDHHELKGLIGLCDFFLGSRMHACIGALSQCIPTVGLAYSNKFKGVFDSIDMQGLVIDLRSHDEKSVVILVDRIYRCREDFRVKLKKIIPKVHESVMNLFIEQKELAK